MENCIISAESEKNEKKELKSTFDDLLEDVKDLEGTLSDYNVAIDKSGLNGMADKEEIDHHHKQIKAKNKRMTQEIDSIFIRKQEQDKLISDLQKRMNHAHQEMEEKLQNMQPENMQYYKDLYDEIQLLQVEGQKKESEIMRLRNNIFEIESSMRGGTNELKLQYKEVKSLQAELLEKKEGVKEQLILSDLDPKEKKAYLLAKVKKNQARSNELDQTLTRMKSEKNKLQHKHQELESNLRGGTHQGESEYSPTRQNEQEMITFFETFQENKARILQEQKDSKINILSLLNNISNRISSTREDLPTKEEYKDMKSEVTFKEIHLKANELTMKKLQEQKKIRIEEVRYKCILGFVMK